MVFLDTNIVIYAVGPHSSKQSTAKDLLASPAAISIQVVNETLHVLQRKLKVPVSLSHETADFLLRTCKVMDLIAQDIALAMRLAVKHGFPHFDALIAANALNNGADILYSEDFHQGLLLEGRMRVVNPFLQ